MRRSRWLREHVNRYRPSTMIGKYRCVVYLLSVFASMQAVRAQENWGGGVDDQAVHFGFFFYSTNSDLLIRKKPEWRRPFSAAPDGNEHAIISDSLLSVSSGYRPGFGLGLVTSFRLHDNVDLRCTPSLTFAKYSLNYEYGQYADVIRKDVSTSQIDLPLSIKLKSDRRKNFRAYLVGGAKYSLAFSSSRVVEDLPEPEKPLNLIRGIMSAEAGIGFDFYFENFKVSPEIKFSQSLNNTLKQENSLFSTPLDRIHRRTIQLSLYFE